MFPQTRSFPCPNCKEMINTEMTVCRFCKSPIDPKVAENIANIQDQVNQACNDAGYLKILSGAFLLPGFLVFRLRLIGVLVFIIGFAVFLYLLIRWQIRYGSLVTEDADFKVAVRWKNIAWVTLSVITILAVTFMLWIMFGI